MATSKKEHILTLVFSDTDNTNGTWAKNALAPLVPDFISKNSIIWNPENNTATVTLKKHLKNEALSYYCPMLTDEDAPKHDRIIQTMNPNGLKVAFFDMDSTVIENECINELADMCGVGAEVAAITHEAMVKGMPFEQSLRKRIEILINSEKLTPEMLEKCYNERIKIKPGARELLQKLNNEGVHTVLVSGGFSFFTKHVAKDLGFKEHYSNLLIFNNEKFSGVDGCPALDALVAEGKLESNIVGAEAKLAVVDKVIGALNKKTGYPQITRANAAFTGDGGNDALAIGAIADAGGMGVAFCDNRKIDDISSTLLAAANVHINHLSSLTQAQWRAPMVQQAKRSSTSYTAAK